MAAVELVALEEPRACSHRSFESFGLSLKSASGLEIESFQVLKSWKFCCKAAANVADMWYYSVHYVSNNCIFGVCNHKSDSPYLLIPLEFTLAILLGTITW